MDGSLFARGPVLIGIRPTHVILPVADEANEVTNRSTHHEKREQDHFHAETSNP
jgi:hypothetical protein